MTFEDLREYGSEAGVRAVRTGVALFALEDADLIFLSRPENIDSKGNPMRVNIAFKLHRHLHSIYISQCKMEISRTGKLADRLHAFVDLAANVLYINQTY